MKCSNWNLCIAAVISAAAATVALAMLPSETITYDGALYVDIARSLLHGLTNYTYQGFYMMYRPPVYVYTLSIVFHFISSGHYLTAARIISAFFYGLTAGLAYLFVVELWGDGLKALSASLFYILNPLAFTMGTRELVHSEFTFFYTLSLYLLYTGRKKGRTGRVYAAFIVAGIAILTRYTGLSIVGVFLVYLYCTEHWGWVRRREYLIGFALVLLVLSPWLYMGHVHYGGAFKPFSVASQYVTGAPPVSAFDYLGELMGPLGILLLLALLGFVLLGRDDGDWLLTSWFFVGFLGILTVTHKEARFVTFLSPAIALLASHGLWGSVKLLKGILPRKNLLNYLAILLLLVLLIPVGRSALALKAQWDTRGAGYVQALEYASTHYPAKWLLVSPRMYTMAGLYYPDAVIQVIVDRKQVRERIAAGRYDVIIRMKTDPLLNVESSGMYALAKEFPRGGIEIYVRTPRRVGLNESKPALER
ncbi:glycosyltransferase family 39 protein [Thermococcus sp.]|uniref:ArnT family glycosyltransferase n=1 Tax=Thermococcus sp. TaxID=35749 RepID=UPI002605C04C|nr:glycosyltransferase family 39 protein [Thermococcus sp.]